LVLAVAAKADDDFSTMKLDVQLTVGESHDNHVWVDVVYQNPTDKPIVITRWNSPFDSVEANIFTVKPKRASNQPGEGRYAGMVVKRMASPLVSECLLLEAGMRVSARIDLTVTYRLSINTYLVQLDTLCTASNDPNVVEMLRHAQSETNRISAEFFNVVSLKSNIIELVIRQQPVDPVVERLAAIHKASNRTISAVNSEFKLGWSPVGVCSSSQDSIIRTILPTALSIADKSYSYLVRATSDRHYVRWFGRYTDTPRGPREIVKGTFQRIKQKLEAPVPIKIYCAPPKCGSSSTFAYVYPYDSTFTVHLCGAFWSPSASSTPTYDSKPGTMVHELSHFEAIGGTDDHTYGSGSAEDLARSYPSKAIYNADNYEYFSETCC
jgi:peptidyl-Lys metalloendopeptidase